QFELRRLDYCAKNAVLPEQVPRLVSHGEKLTNSRALCETVDPSDRLAIPAFVIVAVPKRPQMHEFFLCNRALSQNCLLRPGPPALSRLQIEGLQTSKRQRLVAELFPRS